MYLELTECDLPVVPRSVAGLRKLETVRKRLFHFVNGRWFKTLAACLPARPPARPLLVCVQACGPAQAGGSGSWLLAARPCLPACSPSRLPPPPPDHCPPARLTALLSCSSSWG